MKESTVRKIISMFPKKMQKRMTRRYDRYIFNEDIVNRYDQLARTCQEILFAQRYHDITKGYDWIGNGLSIVTGRGAVGYPFLYFVSRILNEIKPDSILELGMGQSTKLVGQYINTREDMDAYKHKVVEHDANWADVCKNAFEYKHTEVVLCELGYRDFEDSPESKKLAYYVDFDKKLKNDKFKMILIDGPFGWGGVKYARLDILSILPNCLENDFCIIIDDYEREGERNMCRLLEEKLKESSIDYLKRRIYAEKDICLIFSKSLEYIKYY